MLYRVVQATNQKIIYYIFCTWIPGYLLKVDQVMQNIIPQ